MEGKVIDVLVENLTDDKSKAFGRSEYMTSVIFNGKKKDIGKIVQVKIKDSNRNTFIGVNSATIKEHKKIGKILNVTVNFIAEVITCIKDKDQKIISGDPEKIKKIYDTWVFSRDTSSSNPNWQLVNILT